MLAPTRQQRRQLEAENRSWPHRLARVPAAAWPNVRRPDSLKEVWRSREFLVQVHADDGVERLSVCRTFIDDGDWRAEISWDELQRLKRECGRGARDAVEVYPADHDVVNVANMRHLWLVPETSIPFKWKST